jgi:hypothetical protein
MILHTTAGARRRLVWPASAALIAATTYCSDAADPVPAVESLALSLDSIAIQFRDSASELTASPKGALGVDLDAEVTWQSKNTSVVMVVPDGNVARLIPVRPGAADVEAMSEDIIATAKVVVLDTVYSVQISASDTLVSMGRSLQLTAAVAGPVGASQQVVWSVGNAAVADIDSSQGKNPVLVFSRDTGSTTVTATSAIDRNKSASARVRTASPVALYFEQQPGQATSPIRAQDVLIPGPIVKVRDALGNVFPGSVTVTLAIAPGSGTPNASLFGTIVVPTANEDGRFSNLGIDLAGADYRLTATSPDLTAATSAPFTVGPECPGIPYTIGTTVSGTLTADACRASESLFYNRYIVTTSVAELFSARITAPLRVGAVFIDGTRFGAQSDTVPYLAAPGTYSLRVYSGTNGDVGSYQLSTYFANLSKGNLGAPGYLCWRIQTHRGIVYQEELRCSSGPGGQILYPCGSGTTSVSPYRLFLPPNAIVTITASSTAFDPCLEALDGTTSQQIAVDDNGGGGTTARLTLAPSPTARNLIINVSGRPPLPAVTPFTITIQP